MKTINFQRLIIISLVLLCAHTTQAQVTVGSDIPPTRAALMEIKTQQDNSAFSSVVDPKNVTSETGGLLLPRVLLVSKNTLEPFIATTDADYIANTDNLKERLAGLMVYNLTNNGVLYPGLYTWDGEKWMTSQANLTFGVIEEPKSFTFYETGIETVQPLKFEVDGDGAPFTYQWYMVTGNNVHVRIGEPVTQGTGINTDSYTPTQVIKGTTRNANNTGFYKFYCVAENTYGQKLESQIAEVAVGCGAKNNLGEWISFMCFNLGATDLTIAAQKNHTMTFNPVNDSDGRHYYIAGEENLYGDLYQWGRIGDGHEKRGVAQGFIPGQNTAGTNQIAYGAGPTYENGNKIGTVHYYPWQQVARGTNHYGMFIITNDTQNNNWAFNQPANQIDLLWRTGRYPSNDPCAKIKNDGLTYETYYPASDGISGANTAWRTPSQDEWGSIYKGGTISGSPTTATANTWTWNNTNGRGYEIKPDGVTTTLFLPASGGRVNSGALYSQGTLGHYWSINIISTDAYSLQLHSNSVNPAYSFSRSYGFALRCIKDS